MPSNRKFYKTTYIFEILSEEPIPQDLEFMDVLHKATWENYSGDLISEVVEELDAIQVCRALEAQRSSTEFFSLDTDGNDIED